MEFHILRLALLSVLGHLHLAAGELYEQKGATVMKALAGKSLTWKVQKAAGLKLPPHKEYRSTKTKNPKLNPDFVGKDFKTLTKMLGVKPDFRTKANRTANANNGDGRSKRRHKEPRRGKFRGRGDGPPPGWSRERGRGGGRPRTDHRRKRQNSLPESYDWRNFTDCKSFRDIRMQTCGDCWVWFLV
uniref:Uncharacterized protein n=1 Tax=Romanomermis culicivorax TaxID=13658 RepID=A0A915I2Z1_ROMCU